MTGSEPENDDEFPPRRPFAVPARRTRPEPDEDNDGATSRAAGAGGAQPPATPS